MTPSDNHPRSSSRLRTGAAITTSELIVTVALFSLAFYIFSQSLVSVLVLQLLGLVLPIAWSMGILFVLLFLVVMIDFFRKMGSSKRPMGMEIAWLLFLPSIIGYALLDPLKILHTQFALSQIQPQVPFIWVLATAILLAAGDIYFFGIESLRTMGSRLAARGAAKTDLNVAVWKNYLFVVGIVMVTYGIALAGGVGITYLEPPLAQLATAFSYQSILLVILTVSVIAIIIYVYLMRIGFAEGTEEVRGEGNDS